MMDERPPDDGHRQTILNPLLTHVGIGLAQVGGEFRITEEFSRVAFEWLEVPDRPLRPAPSPPSRASRSPAWRSASSKSRSSRRRAS